MHSLGTALSSTLLTRRDAIRVGTTITAATVLPLGLLGAEGRRRVVVWSEGTAPDDKVYREDVNTAIAVGLKKHLHGWEIETANLASPEQGCSENSLKRCDVLIWWGHKRHAEVKNEHVDRIVRRVKEEGMGFIPVHSSHFAKANRRLRSL